jgi:hypothetical protein
VRGLEPHFFFRKNTLHILLPLFFLHKLQKVSTEKSIASYLLEPMFAGSSFFREPPIKVSDTSKKFIGFPDVGLSFDSFSFGIIFQIQ